MPVLEQFSAPSSSVTPGTHPWNSNCSLTPFWDSPCLRPWVCSVLWWLSCCSSPSKSTIIYKHTAARGHGQQLQQRPRNNTHTHTCIFIYNRYIQGTKYSVISAPWFHPPIRENIKYYYDTNKPQQKMIETVAKIKIMSFLINFCNRTIDIPFLLFLFLLYLM